MATLPSPPAGAGSVETTPGDVAYTREAFALCGVLAGRVLHDAAVLRPWDPDGGDSHEVAAFRTDRAGPPLAELALADPRLRDLPVRVHSWAVPSSCGQAR